MSNKSWITAPDQARLAEALANNPPDIATKLKDLRASLSQARAHLLYITGEQSLYNAAVYIDFADAIAEELSHQHAIK